MLPLFRDYPALESALPRISLCSLPTPVDGCDVLARDLHLKGLYVKRDDLSGETHGGNKVRKLEFLLGQALKDGRKEVMTFGFAGSNHALATAIYARQVGLRAISMLMPQPNSRGVRRNLLMGYQAGAELHQYPSVRRTAIGAMIQIALHTIRTGKRPMIIPAGGSAPLGVAGFVNAALELRDQIEARALPEPDWIYVALGSMGTAAGLLLGLRAAGLRTRIAAIRVTEPRFADRGRTLELVKETNDLLRHHCAEFPEIRLNDGDLVVYTEYFGDAYGLYTDAGQEAAALLRDSLHVSLDGTYSAKAFAALVDHGRRGLLAESNTLFWNTFNSRDFSQEVGGVDYHRLPKPFHMYFETELQERDRDRIKVGNRPQD